MRIMVLNDGDTFTNLDNCMIVEVDDSLITEEIEEALSEIDNTDKAKVVATFEDCKCDWSMSVK